MRETSVWYNSQKGHWIMFQHNNRYAKDVSFANIMNEVKDVSQKIEQTGINLAKRRQFDIE
ncbi:hypothetical protein B8A41_04635 [Dolosigranulum pigrum]|nr:hypothetical protein B8A41_04635 [Dolosigranulum pigrum]